MSCFLSSLATDGKVSASTQNQALAALLFLYSEVLRQDLEWLTELTHAKRPVRLPVVMSRGEVAAVLARLQGTPQLMASLLYGSGLRLLECVTLRVKDLHFGTGQVAIRRGKGQKDRAALLPHKLIEPLQAHLLGVNRQHDADLASGGGSVELPAALGLKYVNAAREWRWQWVFPATRKYLHTPTGERRRHHVHETVLQRAVRDAVKLAGIHKQVSCHTFRHYVRYSLAGVGLRRPHEPKAPGPQ